MPSDGLREDRTEMTEVVVGWVGGGRGGVSLTHLITVHRNRDLDAKTCHSAWRIQSACIRAPDDERDGMLGKAGKTHVGIPRAG